MYYQQDQHLSQQAVIGFAHSIEIKRFNRVSTSTPRTKSSLLIQVFFFILFLCAVLGIIYLLAHFLGLDTLAQLHGADRIIDAVGIEKAPNF